METYTSINSLLYHRHNHHLTFKVRETPDHILVESLIFYVPKLVKTVFEDLCEYADNFQKTIILESNQVGYAGELKVLKFMCKHNYGFRRLKKVGMMRMAS